MAQLIQAVDVIQPEGELDDDFFPKGDLNQKVMGWVDAAHRKATADSNLSAANRKQAAIAWVYYLAYSYIAGQIAAQPNSATVNKGSDSISYGQDRPAYWQARAASALASYNGLLTLTERVDSRFSGRVPTVVTW